MFRFKLSRILGHRTLLIYFGVGTTLLAILFLLLTNQFVRELDIENREISQSLTRFLVNLPTALDAETTRLVHKIVMDDVVKNLNFPYILTDSKNSPQIWVRLNENRDVEVWVRVEEKESFVDLGGFELLDDTPPYWIKDNLSIFNHTPPFQDKLEQALKRMDAHYPSVPIYVGHPDFKLEDESKDSILIGYLHYGESDVMKKLRWLPIAQFLVFLLFMVTGLIGYRTLKASEQQSIWAGMAKETAHQLGTPITSLMGWFELLRDPDFEDTSELNRHMIFETMRNDIDRLDKVASRFGKIGAIPDLEPLNVNDIVIQTADYYRHRLPRINRFCAIQVETQDLPVVQANRDLLEWVIENLLKNALDALDKTNSFVMIKTHFQESSGFVEIIIEDNGKGIASNQQNSIFQPGYTTKKRGWGLGLTLARRIVEEYHRGKIRLVRSVGGEGSIFSVILPAIHKNNTKST